MQVVQGVNEHAQTCRLVAPVAADLVRMYDYLRAVDAPLVHDSYAWLAKNKDRVVAMLTKVLANASDGLPDLYFKVTRSLARSLIVNQSINRHRMVQIIKSLQDPPEVGNNLPGIGDNVRERGLEQKCF